MYIQRLNKLREEKEYTQQFVADKLGINRSTYANWETGNIILPLDVADKLSLLYEVPLSYILGIGTIRLVDKKIKPINYDVLRSNLNELKDKNKHSFEVIANYINVDRSTCSRYFNGQIKIIPTDKLILLCELYNSDIDKICGKIN